MKKRQAKKNWKKNIERNERGVLEFHRKVSDRIYRYLMEQTVVHYKDSINNTVTTLRESCSA